MEKNSFSLFETILALTIISIFLGGFLNSSNEKKINPSNLQSIKNEFLLNNTNNLKHSKFTYTYNLSSKVEVALLNKGIHTKTIYNKNNIFLEKNNLTPTKYTLSYKVFQ